MPGRQPAPVANYTAIVDVTILPGLDRPAIRNGVIVIQDSRIVAVGAADAITIPSTAQVRRFHGAVAVPSFWNSHVHFIAPGWQGADTMSASRASAQFRDHFTRYGFTHVFETSSFTHNTLALRARVRSGEIEGPDVMSTLEGFVPAGGSPRYIPVALPVIGDPKSARDSVDARARDQADGIKLFTVPITRDQPFPVMPLAVVRAATDEAHRHHLPVFAHPTNLSGVAVAVAGGVDVLAHTAPSAGALPDSLLHEMLLRRMALTPTLALWEDDYGKDTTGRGAFVRAGENQVKAFARMGGDILFGTDAGYVAHFDPTRAYELMHEAGLSFREILRSLTATPARRFGLASRTGQLAVGYDADIVILGRDPEADIRALADVRLTMKRGRVLFDAGR